ncbi:MULTISPECIES: TetR/AcrR family transcriptional regulator [unclassified Nocardia]|uniref:TetR/AcrR family transcriptional regulator n=1 Tax=unclassified Nocardia TaxID=2637762 RepID=UPI001CE3F355|nr:MULTISPECIES: TetR/AcrR family transcriptional regulator [unclassified Nocardia]
MAPPTAPEDLTARARIRDAAFHHFGEYGFDAATIRGIAETAGVSSGLIRHHFGSKEALRDACDAHLARSLEQINDRVGADPAPGEVNYVAVGTATFGPYQRYLARALVEGRAAPLYDKLVELAERWLVELDKKRTDAPEVSATARAAVGAAMALSVTVLREHVQRALGVDLTSREGSDLLARVLLDLYSHPYLSVDEAAAIRDRLPKA